MAHSRRAASVHGTLSRRIAVLERRGGGTLQLDDGVHPIDRPLRLPACVSLCMTPHAVIRALPAFTGEAVVIKDAGPKGMHQPCGWIRGGVIDGNRQPLTGLRIEHASRLEIADLEVRDATYKGIHAANGWYEVNLSRVRCNVDLDTAYAPGSIGVHYEHCGDSLVQGATIIGYETGLRSDSWSNDFSQVHVWNFDPKHGPMRHSFCANGIYDSYHQCYADSPTVAGFHVSKPFNRITSCRIYYSRWAADRAGAGVLVDPEGAYGTFVGNVFLWDQGHALAKTYAGDLSTASILGGDAGVRMLNQAQLPSDAKPGDLVWLTDKAVEGLYAKTRRGWSHFAGKKRNGRTKPRL